MDRNDFKESVRARKPPDIPEFAVREAVKVYLEVLNTTGTLSPGDVSKCIQIAGGDYEHRRGGQTGRSARDRDGNVPTSRLGLICLR